MKVTNKTGGAVRIFGIGFMINETKICPDSMEFPKGFITDSKENIKVEIEPAKLPEPAAPEIKRKVKKSRK